MDERIRERVRAAVIEDILKCGKESGAPVTREGAESFLQWLGKDADLWIDRMAAFAISERDEVIEQIEEIITASRKEFGDSRHCTAKEAADYIERKIAAIRARMAQEKK